MKKFTALALALLCFSDAFAAFEGNPVRLKNGGTGDASFSANQLVIGGTTSTGSLQQVVGSASAFSLVSTGTSSAPAFSLLGVPGGGLGVSSLTAYSLLAGGTTSTAAVQQIAAGSSTGQVLTYQGSSALPTWQPVSAIGISTDWATYTPTFAGLGTVSGATAQWRRAGDTLEVHGTVLSGTATSGGLSISLPSGISLDTVKASTAQAVQLGSANRIISGGVHPNLGQGPWILFYDGSDATVLFVSASTTQSDNAGTYTKQHADQVIGSGQLLSFNFAVPISSWSSNTIGASQGAVYVHYFGSNASNAPGANLPFNFDSKIDDSGCLIGSCLVTTGASWKFTASVTGTYNGSILLNYSSGTAGNLLLYKNGSFYEYIGEFNTNVSFVPMPFSINLQAGDTLDIRPSTGASFNGGAAPYQMLFSMNLQSGNGGGNVSSSTTSSEHVERALIGSGTIGSPNTCSSSPCTIISQSGSWLTTVTRQSAGNYTATFAAGEFSAAPTCTCSANGNGADTYCESYWGTGSATATNLQIHSSADVGFSLICMGPK